MHGGTIAIASEYGKGTTVTLTLPVVRRVNASEMPRALASADADDIQVLIIEDDASAAELLAGHLRTAGCAVAITTNGDEALRVAAKVKPHAITLDLLVPGDGWTILRKLKEDEVTRKIPILVISVLDEAPRALALGAAGYLVKPVTRDALLHAVEGIGVQLHRVVGVSVLLVGDDSAELRDLWEMLHEVGCHVERSARLARPMTDTPLDIAIVVASDGTPVSSDGCSTSLSVPIMRFGADVDHDGVFALRTEDARRPELLVRRLRAVLDRRTGEAVSA
jgi:CheY-like chemotaxis protein